MWCTPSWWRDIKSSRLTTCVAPRDPCREVKVCIEGVNGCGPTLLHVAAAQRHESGTFVF